jgi:hypothetical protein
MTTPHSYGSGNGKVKARTINAPQANIMPNNLLVYASKVLTNEADNGAILSIIFSLLI